MEVEVKVFRKILILFVLVLTLLGMFASSRPAKAAACSTHIYDFVTYDNGMNGKWGVDHFHSLLTVCQTGVNTYTVTYNDDGSQFVTLNAKSPGGNGITTVSAGVQGTIYGGITQTVQGVLKASIPSSVGTIDWRGHTSPIPYLSPFFDSYTVTGTLSWGWTYKTCGNGTWVDNDASEAAFGTSGPNSLMGDITGAPAACQNVVAPQWFNPNDGRIDGKPGDRLVVWCNQPDQLVVYGVSDDSKGFLLSVFSNKAIRAAGPNGLTKSLDQFGKLSVSEDSQGNFWLAWNGGIFKATGKEPFAKGFNCQFQSSKS